MPQSQNTNRYIVRAAGDIAPLQSFIDSIVDDPVIRLVEKIGPAHQTHTVVIETDVSTAQMLEQRFRSTNQLMIEPDRPLSLFEDDQA
jgi:hypothetical protein